MPVQVKRALFALGVLIVLGAVILGFRRWTANDLERRLADERPFAVRFALTDDEGKTLDALAQAVFFVERRRVLFYFVNTDASYEGDSDPISVRGPASADRLAKFTELSSDYYIHLTRSQLARLIDLAEGVTFFLEEPLIFENAEFQYPGGLRYFSGAQLTEFAVARRAQERGKEYLSGVERLYRIESALLTLLWNIESINKRLDSPEMRVFAAKNLASSNLNPEELSSLAAYLVPRQDIHISVMEAPLELLQENGRQRLVVNDRRARIRYSEFVENLKAGRLTQDSFPVEVLNGTEVGGQARRLKQYIQDRGMPVLHADNYPYKPIDQSYIVDRSGNTFIPARLAELTGLERHRVAFRRQALDVSVTFIIGQDFNPRQLR